LLASFAACSTSEIDPDKLPYRLELERPLAHNTRAVDLDGDGRDEHYYIYSPGLHGNSNLQSLVLHSQTTGVIDQVNFTGHVDKPLFREVDGDGALEILVPVIRNDSLFLTIVDATGRKRYSLFLIDGRPRIEPEGIIPWRGELLDAAVHDFDGDGSSELVTVVSVGYARAPRAVLVHRLHDGARIGQLLVGAKIIQSLIDDFDGDGRPEVFLSAAATNNGGDAGGFSDAHAYLMVVDVWPVPTVKWHRRIAGKAARPVFTRSDFDGDGRGDILVMTAAMPGLIEILDTRSWQTIRARHFPQETGLATALDVDRDGRLEVIVPSAAQGVTLFDDDLEFMAHRRLPSNVGWADTVPDLDGDGIAEIVLNTQNEHALGFAILGPRLNVKAAAVEGWPDGVLRTGPNAQPSVIVTRPNQHVLLKLTRNRMYLVQRFGPGAGNAVGAGLLVLTGLSFVRYRNRHRLWLALRGTALEHSTEGLQLINRKGRILWMNSTLAHWCGYRDTNGRNHGSRIHDLPEPLQRFCSEALGCLPPREFATESPLAFQTGGLVAAARAEPVLTGLATDPHWLIRVCDSSTPAHELTSAWVPLARRTAHDLRNPLTSILLTLQRLQLEYRAAAPEAAPKLDAYANRLQQRVDQLRRMASNLLKLLGDEKLHLEKQDLNAIVRTSAAAIGAGLPPDVRLEMKTAEALPDVVVDREQMESVLENLVANAINALPEGGIITISTHLARGLPLNGRQNGDSVQLEVLDTGVGIDPAVIGRVFEPGFSTHEQGSGLGLAIVRKIVENHGGEVTVSSEVGTGTAFTILLPVADASRTT
jgi:nitrogen-specific signal transduction histidine kinase